MTAQTSIGGTTSFLSQNEAGPDLGRCDQSAATLQKILSAVLMVQKAVDVRGVADCAAVGLLHLTEGSTAAAYIDSGDGEPTSAAAGLYSLAQRERCTRLLMEAATEVKDEGVAIAGDPATLTAAFRSDSLRGALFAERPAQPFGEADRNAVCIFARLVGAAAAWRSRGGRSRLLSRRESALLDGVSVGVLVVADGKAALLNRAGAQLLGMDAAEVVGHGLGAFWPELTQAIKRGGPIEREVLRVRDSSLTVTARAVAEEEGAATGAVVTFESEPAPPGEARRPELPGDWSHLVGTSEAIAGVRDVARVAAQSFSGVLIEGESGVGKEVVAQAIHAAGPRRRQPFIAVLCAAIPRELLESELFGYEPGSFTGASPRGCAGKFELAHGGTLLLDDVVDMPLEMQAKLLRVLQERVVTRVGSSRPRPIDVRIIAISNRALFDAVRGGLFRADLYYRLNVLHMFIPPLRQRREDIKALAEHFLRKHAPAHGSRLMTIGAEALGSLEAHAWPGNVRELEHCIESEIHFVAPQETCLRRLTRPLKAPAPEQPHVVGPLRDLERDLYTRAIAAAAGDISRAARGLGISRGKLYRKLRLHGLLPRDA